MTLQQVKNHISVFRMSTAQVGPYVYGLLVSSLLTVLVSVAYNVFAGKTIDVTLETLTRGGQFSDILIPFAIYFLLLILTRLFENVREYFEVVYNNMIDIVLDYYKYNKNLSLDPQTYIDPKFSTKRTILDWNGWKATEAVKSIASLIAAIVPAILYLGILFSYNKFIGILTALSVLPSIYTNIVYGKRVWAIWDDNSTDKVIWGIYRNSLFGDLTEHKVMGFGRYIIDKMLSLHRKFINKINMNERKRLIAVIGMGLIEYGILAGAYYLLFAGIIAGTYSVGSFVIITAALWGVKRELGNVFELYARLESNANFVDDFVAFVNWKPVITSPENGVRLDSEKPIEIEFRNVWFKYPRSKKWIFKNLNLKVTQDEDIAIVGENGAGKSTLVKLIIRMYDPTKGEILVNGTPLRELDLSSYHKVLGLLNQDFRIYEFSARENIMLGDIMNKKKPKVISRYAKLARADKVIGELKNGYDTFLTTNVDDGQILSGGQNQRLAIARIFYREPRLLILDEPTSAIDALAEEEIFNNIFEYSEKRTVIIISHRFATVKKAQKILVINKGQIVEQGTHEKLLKQKGLYAKMYRAQTAGLLEN